MKLEPVKSSNIEAVGYDGSEQRLTIEFKDGAQYCYEKVPEKTFNELHKAESVGTYFYKNIKTNFECVKIRNKRVRKLQRRVTKGQ